MRKVLTGLFCLLVCASVATDANALLVGNDLSARVKGQQSGNWEIGLGDQVGTYGGFVSTTGPDPFVGTNTYNFTLTYHASTGLATFQVMGPSFTSNLLTTPDYGITGYGFHGIDLGLRALAATGSPNPTLALNGIYLNGNSLPGLYTGTSTYTTYSLYSGPLLTDINLTGVFVFTGDIMGMNERTRFDLNLTGASPVPIPGALVLFGSGLVGLVGIGRRRLQK